MNDFKVSELEVGNRLDKVMTTVVKDYSRQVIQQWIKDGNVTVNNQMCKPNYRCEQDDNISWKVPEKQVVDIPAENIPLEIVYEDEDLLIVNKPKGMLVHPTAHVHTQTLVNALKYHCDHLSTISGEDRPGIVHRLDQDTSGLLIVAKNNATHSSLKEQFQQRTVLRVYEAIVFGVIQHEKGIIQAPIGRNPKNRLQMAVVSQGKEAETHFRTLERFKQYTHVECELKTGRTHQIRVHLKYMNHPVVGDELYVRKKSTLIKGQALFAKRLEFIHPVRNEKMVFEIDPPNDFSLLLHRLQTMA